MRDRGSEPRSDDPLIDEAAAWLAKLRLSGGAAEQDAFESWYAADPAHAAAYDQVLRGWEASNPRAPSAVASSSQSHGRPTSRTRVRHAFAAAAAILLIVLSGIGLNRAGLFGGSRVAGETELASIVGEIHSYTLADGSRVTLDTGSMLRIAFSPGERRIILERGRARFDVAHDAGRPFVVLAGSGSVTARGTLFDVALIDAHVTVALLRGSVEVCRSAGPPGSGGGMEERLLAPGQSLVMSRAGPLQQPRPVRASDTRWVSGMLSFENAPLAEAVAAANRYNVSQIILVDAASRNLRFTGTFRAADVEGFARMLAVTFHLQLTQDDKHNFLLAASAR